MGRPARFDSGVLVAAATALAARAGPGAVTMAAVAREAGAPSGSVYHRFPGRPALLAAVRLDALADFQEGVHEALAAEDPLEAAVGAARHVLSWSRGSPDRARVLLYSDADFEAPRWPAAERVRRASTPLRIHTSSCARSLSKRAFARASSASCWALSVS